MPIKTFTLSSGSSIWMTKFHALKPHASVTFDVMSDASLESQIDQAAPALRQALLRALKTEIEFWNEAAAIQTLVDSNPNTDALYAWAVGQIEGTNDAHTNKKPVSEAVDVVPPVAPVPSAAAVPSPKPAVGGGGSAQAKPKAPSFSGFNKYGANATSVAKPKPSPQAKPGPKAVVPAAPGRNPLAGKGKSIIDQPYKDDDIPF